MHIRANKFKTFCFLLSTILTIWVAIFELFEFPTNVLHPETQKQMIDFESRDATRWSEIQKQMIDFIVCFLVHFMREQKTTYEFFA